MPIPAGVPKPLPVAESTWALATEITPLVTELTSRVASRVALKQPIADADSEKLAALIVLTSELGQVVEQLQEIS